MAHMKLKLKMRHFQKCLCNQFDLQKLKDQEVEEVFQAQVGRRFVTLISEDSDVDTLAGNVMEVLQTTTDEVLGKLKRRKQPWITSEILDLCDKRGTLKKDYMTSRLVANSFRVTNKKIRNNYRMKETKED